MYGKRLKIHRSQMTLLVSPLFLFRVVTDSRLFFPPTAVDSTPHLPLLRHRSAPASPQICPYISTDQGQIWATSVRILWVPPF